MNEYYFEFDREGKVNVVNHVEKDGDRAVDIFSIEEFEEMLRKYPSVVSKEFYEFVQDMREEAVRDE